jgi:type IV pilus assembly protein PilC
MEASSVPALLLQAARQGDPVVSLAEEGAHRADPPVTELELATFYRQLASMLQAGLGLPEGLQILARDTSNQGLKQVCYALYLNLAAGRPLATGLAQFPGVFPRLHLALARAGEHAGLLPVTLSHMADYLERIGGLTRRFSSALVYPAVVGGIVLLILSAYWGTGIIAKMTELYAEFDVTLPYPTRAAIAFSRVALPATAVTIVAVFVIVVLLRTYYRTRRGRYALDRAKLGLPFVGQIVHKGALARFCRTLALLLDNNVEIASALDLAGEATGNAVMGRAVRASIGQVTDGRPVGQSLADAGVFPPGLTDHVTTGEKSGTLVITLNSLSDFYDAQAEHFTRAFSAVIEPLLIVVLGLAVGSSIISVMLPLISIISSLSE